MPGERIVVADDEAIILTQLEDTLHSMGYDVVALAGSAEEALEQTRTHRPDLVLMDVAMPGKMDGIEACTAIQRDMDIPVIIVTGSARGDLMRRALAAKPSGYIVKPHTPHQVRVSIENALDRKSLERERVARLQEQERQTSSLNASLDKTMSLVQLDLSTLLGLFDIQANIVGEPPFNAAMDDVSTRVKCMLNLQATLHAEGEDEYIPCVDHLRAVAQAVRLSHCIPDRIEVDIEGDNAPLPKTMLKEMGLITQELMVNAARHAFSGSEGLVEVSIKRGAGAITMNVCDNGSGFPCVPSFRKAETHGLDLVHRAVARLNGSMQQYESGGIAYSIVIPIQR